MQAAAEYETFLQGAGRSRYDVWRTLLERSQTRRIVEAMEGKSFANPPPHGICSAYLLQEAEEKHRQRKTSILQASMLGAQEQGPSVHVESNREEQEADQLLKALESQLGYDFSLPEV